MTISVSYNFHDAVVLITGSGSGIGAALTRYCARQGASVIAIDKTHEALLRNLDRTAVIKLIYARSTFRMNWR